MVIKPGACARAGCAMLKPSNKNNIVSFNMYYMTKIGIILGLIYINQSKKMLLHNILSKNLCFN